MKIHYRARLVSIALSIFTVSVRASEGLPPLVDLIKVMKERSLDNTRQVFDEAGRLRGARLNHDGEMVGTRRAQALEPENAATTVDRLTVAIKTGLDGTVAGVSVAPFGLSENRDLRGFNIILAALEADQTRAGVSFSRDLSDPLLTAQSIGLDACELKEKEVQQLLDRAGDSFGITCREVLSLTSQPPPLDAKGKENRGPLKLWHIARVACGQESPTPLNPGPNEGLTFTSAIVGLVNAIDGAAKVDARVARAIEAFTTDVKTLRDFDLPSGESCHTKDEFAAAFLRTSWNQRRVRFGLSLVGDFYPRRSGFNPDETKRLPSGETSKWQGRVEFSVEKKRTAVAAGVGLGKAREDLASPLRSFIAPAFSISKGILNLSPDPVVKEGALNLQDGKVPPSVVLGLNIKMEIALAKAGSQATRFNRIEILPFLDFKISDKLSVRLGAPIQGGIVTRAADDAKKITERRALQWVIPVSVVTVIKL